MAKQPKDADGFTLMSAKPGGLYDTWRRQRAGKEKIPKNPDKLLDIFLDAYGTDQIANMSEVNIGDYIYNKGINHSLNMNVGRNIPWIEDGLKRVERRIMYAMYQTKLYKGRFSKVSTVTGVTIAKFHPHGDLALNDTVYRLGRRWSMMLPYIKGIGNYGNMDEMHPAAPRYASASLSDYAYDCFFSEMGTKFPIFEVIDNYNYSGKEPVYLTSKYPNILMQWNQGIGKGASSWLGAFNSRDVFAAALKMIEDPNAKVDIYPDTPMPIDIINKRELKHCFDQKKFKVKMRAPFKVVADKKRDERGRVVDKFTLIFTALPINVIGKTVKDEVIALKLEDDKRANADKRIPEVLGIDVDASDKYPGGVEVIIEYEKGYDPYALAEKLYKSTSLGSVIGVQYVLVSDNMPVYKTPREIMQIWITQRYDQKRRYYHQLVLKAARDRAILEASCILLESNNIDLAIKLIKESKNDEESITKLCKAFKFTEFQASMVIKMELRSLNRMNIDDIRRQRDQALEDYKKYRKILSEDEAIKDIIREELREGSRKYGKDRVARLTNLDDKAAGGDPDEEKHIFWNSSNYMSATGPDAMAELTGRLDRSYQLLRIRNSDKILVYGKNGYVKLLDGYAFSGSSTGIGFAQLAFPEVAGIVPLDKRTTQVAMVTKFGYGKIMTVDDSLSALKSKQIALNPDDVLQAVVPVYEDSVIGMVQGDTMHYVNAQTLPTLKRTAAGNRILKTDTPIERVVQFQMSNANRLLVYCDFGHVKVLDMGVLKFGRRKPDKLTMGKDIYGAIALIDKCEYALWDDRGSQCMIVHTVPGPVITFNACDDKTTIVSIKIGTTISSTTKAFKKGRNEFYAISPI